MFTLVSGNTGAKFFYELTSKDSETNNRKPMFFVRSIMNRKLTYCGVIIFNMERDKFQYFKGKKGTIEKDELAIKSLLYVLNRLHKEDYEINVQVYHAGVCGRCGRQLTVPESIKLGLGAECARKSGIK